MKKLSLLMALIVLVTIGGVYATWNYAQGNVSTAQGFALPKMETVVTTGTKGSIAVDVSGLTIKIDDDANDAYTHKAVLKMDGELKINFTPAVGADESVANNGIKMRVEITCTENWKYDEKNIFTVDTSKNVIITDSATKEIVITADELAEIIQLNDFTLATYSEFQEFQTILNRGNIKIQVSEVVQTES
ncbi:MAG: hypothetical protein E7593_03590 [Ruminococcaceae bacterium]|nr:hypothetical protein [Oscillospiraceae bacterium]